MSRVDKTQKEFRHKRVANFGLDMLVISHNAATVGKSMIGYDLNRHVQMLRVLGGGCKSSLRMVGVNPQKKIDFKPLGLENKLFESIIFAQVELIYFLFPDLLK